MEGALKYTKGSQPNLSVASKQRSGYEPSDTETDWQDSPWRDQVKNEEAEDPHKIVSDLQRNISPLKLNRRYSSMFEYNNGSPAAKTESTRRRSGSKSPYKPRKEDGTTYLSSKPASLDFHTNITSLPKPERRRHVSPYKSERLEHRQVNHNTDMGNDDDGIIIGSNRKQARDVSRMSEKSNHSRRSATAPKSRTRLEKEQPNEQRRERTPSPLGRNNNIVKQREAASHHVKTSSSSLVVGELNEMIANAKISREPILTAMNYESTESISPGDIFFSRDHTAFKRKPDLENRFTRKSEPFLQTESVPHQRGKSNGSSTVPKSPKNSTSTGFSRTNMTASSSVMLSSKFSDASGRSSVSSGKFTANIQKSQTMWFSCMRKGPCSTSRSPEKRTVDEASFIGKAFVVEELKQFWADKHRPGSLNGFTCHKQEAQLLKQLALHENFPHILLKGPSGSGKKALAMALLCEIYGDPCRNISHELRNFPVQEKRSMQVSIPLTSSAHHVELDVNREKNAKFALMGLVKEISNNYAIIPEVSKANFKADFKVLVLYDVCKAPESIQHLVKWIMDCYTDVCKLILCCEDDGNILESVTNRSKVIKVDAPVTHEIMEILVQIARKEEFDLSMSFAAKIATKSKQNLRKAIMALEACKAHNYPFADDQPIPLGWEEVLIELAAEILSDPSPNRLFFVRGKLQKLLVDFVHPKLILQKLVEQFLKGVGTSLKREIFYWHAYYDKRLPIGTTALLKLEEFVAKFMSIYRKSYNNGHYM